MFPIMCFILGLHLSSSPSPPLPILGQPVVTAEKPYSLPDLRPTPISFRAIHDGDFYFINRLYVNMVQIQKVLKHYNDKSGSFFSLALSHQKPLLLPLAPFRENLCIHKHIHVYFFRLKQQFATVFLTYFFMNTVSDFTSVHTQLPPSDDYVLVY